MERGSEIWEDENQTVKIEAFVEDLIKQLNETSKSSKDSYINQTLREIFEEEKVLEAEDE
ncbi:unnamed protein product [marine sediment metagenome]|uniref:Uncharacterized protein n=1 Tax=marine sediment metagenome TaxID=412755 RepID=X0Y8Z4_9ZZZZ